VKKWACPSCGRNRATAFCPTCGEEPLRPRDLSVGDILAQLIRALTSLDGRLARSVRALLLRPGSLSQAHVVGQRRSYLGPFPLFLLANAMFFAVQSVIHLDVFSSTLDSHLHHQDWSGVARTLVEARLAEQDRSLASFAPAFDQAAVLNAKSLIILMALIFLPLLPVFFHRAGRTIGAHFVFALHLYAFILILMCVSLLLAEGQLLAGGQGLASPTVDLVLSLFNLAAVATYLYFAVGEYYGVRGVGRIAKAATLAIAVGAIVLGYRFLIFLVTLYTA
jgi:hypothetical protein